MTDNDKQLQELSEQFYALWNRTCEIREEKVFQAERMIVQLQELLALMKEDEKCLKDSESYCISSKC